MKEHAEVNTPTIELATEEHISDILRIEKESWVATYPNEEEGITTEDVTDRFSPDFLEQRAKEIREEMSGGHSYRIVRKGKQIIGYSHLLKETDYNDLVEVYVQPQSQGKGVGSMIVQNALDWFGNDKPVRLEVATYNQRAINFYKKCRFVEAPHLNQAPGENWNILPSGKRIPVIFMERKTLS